jgi:D-methionine transport system permease protein
MEIIEKIMPNAVKYWSVFIKAIGETFMMVGISLVFIIVFGVIVGIVLAVISKGHLYENRVINAVIPKIVNLIRAVPFIILLAVLIPLTRLIAGTAIGVRGAIVPMVIAMTPFSSPATTKARKILME